MNINTKTTEDDTNPFLICLAKTNAGIRQITRDTSGATTKSIVILVCV